MQGQVRQPAIAGPGWIRVFPVLGLLAVAAATLVADGTAAASAIEPPSRLYVLTYAPDGHWLAGMGDDGQIRFWNTADGAPLRTSPPPRTDA
jgi:WD40 repeat protein